jgi:predicted nucleic acid-binding protein
LIVADTSVWIEFLRGSDQPVADTLTELLRSDATVALSEIIVMELLAGATSNEHQRDLRVRLVAFPILRLEGLMDFEEAALLFRRCREAGETIRGLTDCLTAVPVIRAGGTLLHRDADFDAIARHSDLKVHHLE